MFAQGIADLAPQRREPIDKVRINLLGKEPLLLHQILFDGLQLTQAVTGQWVIKDDVGSRNSVLLSKVDGMSDGCVNLAIDM